MSRLGSSILATALGLALAAAPSAAAPACPTQGVLASGPQAVLLTAGAARSPLGGGGALESCLRRDGRVRVLRRAAAFTRFGPVALRGTVAALAISGHGVDTSSASVAVIDLASGRTLRSASAASPATRPESFVSVAAIVLGPGAATAWVAETSGVGAPRAVDEIRRLDAHGDALLARSATITPGSLRLAAHGRLSWRDGARTHTAAL